MVASLAGWRLRSWLRGRREVEDQDHLVALPRLDGEDAVLGPDHGLREDELEGVLGAGEGGTRHRRPLTGEEGNPN